MLLRLERRRLPLGVSFAATLALLASYRIGLDFLRHHEPGAVLWRSGDLLLTVHQVFCLVLIAHRGAPEGGTRLGTGPE